MQHGSCCFPSHCQRTDCWLLQAGKYRTAAVTDEGDVYMWEGLSKQHPHRKRAAKDASLPPRPDKAASRKLSLSDIITPER